MCDMMLIRYLTLFTHLLAFTNFSQCFKIMVEMFFSTEKNEDGGGLSDLGTSQLG